MKALFTAAVQNVPSTRYLHNVTSLQMFKIANDLTGNWISPSKLSKGFSMHAAVALHDNLPMMNQMDG